MDKPLIKFRSIQETDLPFIYQTWLKTCRKESDYTRSVESDVYYPSQKVIINSLLARSNTIAICNPDLEYQIYGYLVYEPFQEFYAVHFAYVKVPYRRLGFLKAMFSVMQSHLLLGDDLPIVITHKTRMFDKIAPKMGLLYNPFLARMSNEENQIFKNIQLGQMRGV